MKRTVAIAMSVIMIVATSITALADSVKVALLELICDQSFTESEVDQTAKIDLKFTYTADGQATTVDAPHKYITLKSSNNAIVLNEVVLKSVNGNGTEFYDKDSDIVDDVDTNPWPAYIDSDGKDISGGKFLVETYVDETRKTDFESIVLTATYTIPANTAKGEYTITATADATDYTEADYADVTADYTLVIAEKVVEPECEHTDLDKEVLNVTATEFIYDCVCKSCGETFEKKVPINPNEIAGNKVTRTIKPGNDISIWFMYKKEQNEGYTDLCLVTEKEVYEVGANEPNEEKQVDYIDDYSDGVNSSGVLCDSFVYDKLAAYEMANVVSAKLYGLSAAGEMQLLKSTTYSIKQFIDGRLEKDDATVVPDLKKTFVDILNYGAASQLLSDIMMNTDDLVNADLTEAIKAYGTPESEYCTASTEFVVAAKSAVYNTESPVGYVTPVTTIAPETKVNIYFKYRTVAANGSSTYFTGDVNNLYCRFYFTDTMGNPDTYTYKYDGLMRDGLNAFKFDKQPIAQLDTSVKAVVYYGNPDDAENSYWIMEKEYSIESFISSKIANPPTPQVGKVLQTIYAYGYSLKNCIEKGLV